MAKIIQRDMTKRLAPLGSTAYFEAHPEDWVKLRAGQPVSIPDDQEAEISAIYGGSIKTVTAATNEPAQRSVE